MWRIDASPCPLVPAQIRSAFADPHSEKILTLLLPGASERLRKLLEVLRLYRREIDSPGLSPPRANGCSFA